MPVEQVCEAGEAGRVEGGRAGVGGGVTRMAGRGWLRGGPPACSRGVFRGVACRTLCKKEHTLCKKERRGGLALTRRRNC